MSDEDAGYLASKAHMAWSSVVPASGPNNSIATLNPMIHIMTFCSPAVRRGSGRGGSHGSGKRRFSSSTNIAAPIGSDKGPPMRAFLGGAVERYADVI